LSRIDPCKIIEGYQQSKTTEVDRADAEGHRRSIGKAAPLALEITLPWM
jgi:hypothetical protein